MNLLYISRHTFIQTAGGEIYSTGMMGSSYFEKYLPYFDTVTVTGYLCRETASNAAKKAGSPIRSTDRIRYRLAPSDGRAYRLLVTSRALKDLTESEIRNADAVACKSASGSDFAASSARKYHKPYLVEVVGCAWDSLWNHSMKGRLLALPSYLSLRSVVQDAPFVLYVTNVFLQQRYPARGQWAGISDVELQNADQMVLDGRIEKIRNHRGSIRLGTAGALHVAYKGQQYVIRALALLRARGRDDFEYHLAGGGDHTRLSELAERLGVADQVIFDGVLPHDQMFDWLDSLDVYLQPSLVEGMPRALIEAMSRGLPAFGSDLGGIPELLDRDAVFPRGRADKISGMLDKMSGDDMVRMAARNFEHAKRFQKEELEKQRKAFYSAFAEEARRSKK